VSAWKPGSLQIDFPGNEAPALKAWPQSLDYHHLRGSVSSHEVRVMKTVTVMGRLVDKHGVPLGGARVVNHAGRTVTEADGMFTLELHENNPVATIEHHSGLACEIRLDPHIQKRDELIFAGNVRCEDTALAATPRNDADQTG
ncbi:CS1-pili formation C-terminal domain-containing protein, partial [Serratia marcescens]|uniref:CS1-pili formation C-terminal domain-containing protein n=1 Tax=Serratia marcescens TaxID=615 RepID=UPI0016532953